MFGDEIPYRTWRIRPRRMQDGYWTVFYHQNQIGEYYIQGYATADEAIDAARQAIDQLI